MTRSPRLLGWGFAALLTTFGLAESAFAQPAPTPTAKPRDKAPKKPEKKPEAAAETPKDAAEAEAHAPDQAPASTTEPLPDPTPGPDPFRNDPNATPSWASAPTSASGSQLIPTDSAQSAGGGGGGASGPRESDQSARIRALEQRLANVEQGADRDRARWAWLSMFKVSGYLQPQLVWSWFNQASSPNVGASGALPAGIAANDVIAKSDGTTTNPDFFRLRRARLKMEFSPSEYARGVFEIDPQLLGGATATGTVARNIEAIGRVPWTRDVVTEFGMGIFKVPFSHEIVESDADRPFIERSYGEQSMFPAEFDTGIHAYTHADYERFIGQIAVVNGTTIGEKNFAVVPDLNKGKDIVGRVNYDFGLFDFGLGGYYGEGQAVDPATLRFKQFPRWAGNLEGALHHTFAKKLGGTRLFVEFTLAKNMDRGTHSAFTVPTIPLSVTSDVEGKDERSWQLRLEQDLTRWVTLGARYDAYAPDTAQKDDQRQTLSFVAAVHFTKALQWMLEFDHAGDHIHAPNGGIADKRIETLSNVLQVRF